jgi:hypothetical protein
MYEVSETEDARLAKPGEPPRDAEILLSGGTYRTASGAWYGLIKHWCRQMYTGSRAMAAESHADAVAARSALAAT